MSRAQFSLSNLLTEEFSIHFPMPFYTFLKVPMTNENTLIFLQKRAIYLQQIKNKQHSTFHIFHRKLKLICRRRRSRPHIWLSCSASHFQSDDDVCTGKNCDEN
jgi:hypothetical protein